ncbi:MAG TPA: hypothetical protein VLM89_03085 [Phycisphaerae bacterium]|nr:hypothetical protein [Phycisphaerae bacterium]
MTRRAVSYIEVVVAVAVLGTGMAMGLGTYGAFARGAAGTREMAAATELAAQLAAEIRTQAFEDAVQPVFGPEPGESDGTRMNFDDVDDYHNYSASPPKLRDGTTLTDFTGYAQRVTVVSNVSTGLRVITVTITVNGRKRAEIVLARARHGADQR